MEAPFQITAKTIAHSRPAEALQLKGALDMPELSRDVCCRGVPPISAAVGHLLNRLSTEGSQLSLLDVLNLYNCNSVLNAVLARCMLV